MSFKETIEEKAILTAFDYVYKEPKENILKIVNLLGKIDRRGLFTPELNGIKEIMGDKNSIWPGYMEGLLRDIDKDVAKTLFRNLVLNSALKGYNTQKDMIEKYDCNIPWAILLDPTSACNLKCIGCWAAEYGHSLNLDYDTIDSIITQGKELGVYFYIYTGGEPLVRKKDLIKLCEKHNDCVFLCFTNSTLIDEEFANEMLRVKNFVPAISVEGYKTATDSRRGEGTYDKVMSAFKLLKSKKLPFGISCCYTSQNEKDITSSEFFDSMIEWGAKFTWFFHYMPVGQDAHTELLLSPEQREHVYRQIRKFRSEKPIFTLDFQNDAEYVGGCIAGGEGYLHINANGDVEPCVFIHYSNVNIHDCTLLEALHSPIFMQYYHNQPFNDNMLRPCPMLENPTRLRQMVKESRAQNTDYQSRESAEHLCSKTDEYAKAWKPVADKLWEEKNTQ